MIPEWRTQLGHAVADAVQDTLGCLDPEMLASTDPRVLAAEVYRIAGTRVEVQRALVTWCRGVGEAAREGVTDGA